VRRIPPSAAALAAGLALATPSGAAPPDAADAATLERGRRVMRDFCLSCHVLEAGQGATPLRPRLRPDVWGDPERAYALVGDLPSLSRRMDQPFRGTDEDRRALAAAVAAVARENRVPAWRAALPYAGLAAAVAGAAAFLAWARRRGG
jgi:mono/diheme cytochrome c family protein